MATGDPGEAGPSVPRPVEEELKIAPDPVTLQDWAMLEMLARENLQIQPPATHTNVS